MTKSILFSVLLAASSGLAYSQELAGTLWFDTSRMKVTVGMDRQTYLPGEVAQVTLTVSNPTSSPVVGLLPFVTSTGCVSELERTADGPRVFSGETCASVPVGQSNTMTFAAGESKRIVMNSYDRLFDIDAAVLPAGAVRTRPGTYEVHYVYGAGAAAKVEYSVAPARLEVDTVARLHDVMYSDFPKVQEPSPVPTYVHVLALRSDQVSYICVGQSSVSSAGLVAMKAILDQHPDFDDRQVQVGAATPLKRIATSSAPVVSLSAVADVQENLTITWKDSDGVDHQEFYPASYPVRDAREQRYQRSLEKYKKR